MHDLFFTSKEISREEDGMKLLVEYSVLVNELPLSSGSILDSFGVKIELYDVGGQKKLMDSAKICDITQRALVIDRLIMLLSECTVTPVSVYEVLDDILAEPEHYFAS